MTAIEYLDQRREVNNQRFAEASHRINEASKKVINLPRVVRRHPVIAHSVAGGAGYFFGRLAGRSGSIFAFPFVRPAWIFLRTAAIRAILVDD